MQKHKLLVIDLDVIARQVVEVDATRREILKAFPAAAGERPPGAPASSVPPINRAKLGEIIFSDPSARAKLNRLMSWPITRATLVAVWRSYWAGYKIIVLDAPLLFESGLHRLCSATITVFIESEEEQIKRLVERDAAIAAQDPTRPPPSVESAKARIDAQMPLERKRKLATYELDNSTTVEELHERLDWLVDNIKRTRKPLLPRNSVITYSVTLFFLLLMFVAYKFLG